MTPPSSSLLKILSCSNSTQLADFCSLAMPNIWGQLKQQPLKRTVTFKQYCQKLIKATQISCACILVAFYYIHRLRSAYPFIHASIGSEIRLFTTALVLANKYLDDNTFTNKTWSEVSNIPVLELNIMEMEFLSALQYNIHVPYDQFFKWVLQCHSWIVPTLLLKQQQQQQQQQQHLTTPPSPLLLSSSSSSSSIPSSPCPSSSLSTPHLKRSLQYDDSDDEYSTYTNNNKRRSTNTNHHHHQSYQPKMPYTPPETYQPIHPYMYQTQVPQIPPPAYPMIHPMMMANNNNNSNGNSQTNPIILSNYNDCHRPILSWSSSSSALASSSHHHYSTRLLATRVRNLEID